MLSILYFVGFKNFFNGLVRKLCIALCEVGRWDEEAGWIGAVFSWGFVVFDEQPRRWDTSQADPVLHIMNSPSLIIRSNLASGVSISPY